MQERIFAGKDGAQLTREWGYGISIDKHEADDKFYKNLWCFAAKNGENLAGDQLLWNQPAVRVIYPSHTEMALQGKDNNGQRIEASGIKVIDELNKMALAVEATTARRATGPW